MSRYSPLVNGAAWIHILKKISFLNPNDSRNETFSLLLYQNVILVRMHRLILLI